MGAPIIPIICSTHTRDLSEQPCFLHAPDGQMRSSLQSVHISTLLLETLREAENSESKSEESHVEEQQDSSIPKPQKELLHMIY